MIYTNTCITTITDFVILGFPGLDPKYNAAVSVLLFFTYLAIVFGNLLILVFVGLDKRLYKPTYLIFCHLAMTDLLFGTVTLPKAISKYWWDDKIVSFGGCFTQMYFVHALGAIQSLLLLIMALDHFISVCLPLKYPVLITNNKISIACGLSWIFTFFRMMIIVFHALSLPYCDSNIIVQCYCDHISIVRLGCGENVRYVQRVALGFAMFSLLLPVSFILFSYTSIFVVILRMRTVERSYKTFSTCTPQLFITFLYYLPRCFAYVANNVGFSFNLDIHILVTLLYSLIPCVFNPLIYCFKTRDIKDSLMRKLTRAKVGMKQVLRKI
ncbi:olfactory receptor 52E8-like [Thalassophryne amazonica]|uniref:olfactory receptor 52E8-like n=1 Tax=Thalassophryne amazonica TaxID=390379 RepID=UPI00147103A3|nr:olfactory receptor 52E8-like [Thalassophryne amazonica]